MDNIVFYGGPTNATPSMAGARASLPEAGSTSSCVERCPTVRVLHKYGENPVGQSHNNDQDKLPSGTGFALSEQPCPQQPASPSATSLGCNQPHPQQPASPSTTSLSFSDQLSMSIPASPSSYSQRSRSTSLSTTSSIFYAGSPSINTERTGRSTTSASTSAVMDDVSPWHENSSSKGLPERLPFGQNIPAQLTLSDNGDTVKFVFTVGKQHRGTRTAHSLISHEALNPAKEKSTKSSRQLQATPKKGSKFTPWENQKLMTLREDNIPWKKIKRYFPNRSQGSLQVHYNSLRRPKNKAGGRSGKQQYGI
jgi:hypothetical protein